MGATGHIGFQVSRALAAAGVSFKAAVHSVAKAEKVSKISPKIEIVELDIYNPQSFVKALEGVDRLFLLTPPGQNSTQITDTILEASKKAGVKHIVKLSAMGADDPQFIWGKEHLEVEQRIQKSGVTWTILRPSSFFANIYDDQKTLKEQSLFYRALGDVKVNWISQEDIGEIAAKALIEPGHHAGKIYTLCGPDVINGAELAAILSDKIGKKITYIPITDDQLKGAVSFLPPPVIDGLVNMFQQFRTGIYAKTTPDVEKVLGKKPRAIADYVAANAADFK